MSEILSREQVEDVLVCMNHPETDGVHYAKFYRELMAHDAALRAQLADMVALLDDPQALAQAILARQKEKGA